MRQDLADQVFTVPDVFLDNGGQRDRLLNANPAGRRGLLLRHDGDYVDQQAIKPTHKSTKSDHGAFS